MAVTATPPLALSDLVTEFGTDGSTALSDYVRGGALVPDTAPNAAVSATSAGLQLSQFYSTSAADIIPDAVDWTDTSGSVATLTGNTQTITGITVAINLKITFTGGTNGITYKYKKNSDGYVDLVSGDVFSVSSGDVINFRGVRGAPGADAGTLSVYNNSNGDSFMDGMNWTWT